MRKSKSQNKDKNTLLSIMEHISDEEIVDLLNQNYMRYTFAVMEDRALPDARDGLKPSQRRILIAMHDLNLHRGQGFSKVSKIAGDCFVAGTLVSTPKGLVPIEELKEGDLVHTSTGTGEVTQAYFMPPQPLQKITFVNGSELKVTPGQKFKVFTPSLDVAWKRVDEIAPGEYVVSKFTPNAVKDRQSIHGFEIAPDIAYAWGNFLADGWVDRNPDSFDRVCYACSDRKVIDAVDACLKSAFDKISSTVSPKKKLHILRVNGREANAALLALFGVNKRASNIEVPRLILRSPIEVQKAFVAGYVDGDGSAHKTRAVAALGSVSEKFIRQMQAMLLTWGVHSRYYGYEPAQGSVNGRKVQGTMPMHYIEVTGRSLSAFADQLPVLLEKKRARFARVIARTTGLPEKLDMIPYLGDVLLAKIREAHLGGGWYACAEGKRRLKFGYASGGKLRRPAGLSVNLYRNNPLGLNAKEIASEVSPDLAQLINLIERENLYFSEVEAVSPMEPEETYDIQVKTDHEFVAEGLVVHNCMGNYHPHGDQVITPTIVRLGQDWVLRYPLVAKQGNFGNIDGDPPAAARYIEARLSRAGASMLADLSPSVVPYQPNYNDDPKFSEPTVLPSVLPNLLVNGGAGIAVGVACKLAPHNLREVVSLIKGYISNPKMTVDEAMEIMPGPDFPTGGVIRGTKGIRSYFESGRGSIQVEGIYEIIDEGKGGQYIKITGVPYGVSPENLAEQIANLVKDKKIEGISDLKDLGYLNRKTKERVIDVRVWIARGANPQLILNQLLKSTSLRSSFDVNQTVLIDGVVVENVPILELVRVFVNHRKTVLTNKFSTERDENAARIHILDGLLKVALNIDKAIKIIRAANDAAEAMANLISAGLVDTEVQAEAVLNITLRKLTKLESSTLETERLNKVERNEWLTDVLNSDKKLLKEVAKEQDEIAKQIGDDRRTQIGHDADDISAEDLIPEEEIIVSLTKDGYIKRVPVSTFRVQNRGGKGVIGVKGRAEDEAADIFSGSTHDLYLFFTSKGQMFKKKGYQIPEASRTGKGTHLANLLALSSGEYVTSTISLKSLDVDGFFLMATKHGLIKRTEIREYNTALKTKGLQAMKLNEGDEVAFVKITDGHHDVALVTANGMAVRYPESTVRVVGRVSLGVRAMNLTDTDEIVSMLTLEKKENPEILVITERGYGKRTNAGEYRCLQGRYAKGVKTIDQVKQGRNGLVKCAVAVSAGDAIIILTTKGKMIQIKVDDIPSKGRITMGNIIVDVDKDDSIRDVAKVTLQEDDFELV